MFEPLPGLYRLGQQRYADYLREAEETRLAKLATAHQGTFAGRLLAKLGDFFISFGNSLKRRDQHEVLHSYTPFLRVGRKGEL